MGGHGFALTAPELLIVGAAAAGADAGPVGGRSPSPLEGPPPPLAGAARDDAGRARLRARRAAADRAHRPPDDRLRGRPVRLGRSSAARNWRSPSCATRSTQRKGGDQAAVVAFGARRARRAPAGRVRRHRPLRVGAAQDVDGHRRALCGWRRRCFRTTRRSASCWSATATTRPAAASRRRALAARARHPDRDVRRRPGRRRRGHRPGPQLARHGARGREHQRRGDDQLDGRPAGNRAPVRRRHADRRRSRSTSRPGLNARRVRRAGHRRRLAHLPRRRRGRARHVRPEQPRRLAHHRQGRPADPA